MAPACLLRIPLLFVLFCLLTIDVGISQESWPKFDRHQVFEEVSKAVQKKFWDGKFGGTDWQETSNAWRDQATQATSHDGFADAINGMLATLKTSHTHYFPATDPKHDQLLGIFELVAPESVPERYSYDGIGIETRNVDGQIFVSAVFDGLTADRAGMKFGDEIISVDSAPFHPLLSFHGKAGTDVDVLIRKTPGGKPQSIKVLVETINGRTMFELALKNSARVIEKNGKKIGYVHLWSYAGLKYHEQLVEMVLWGKLASCDALVIDFRDGWGGASLDYVNLFREPLVKIESQSRTGEQPAFTGVWGKPVSLLINSGSTSGKELYAYAFRKHKLGMIVGERSAGAVVAGQCIPLSNGDVLYLAVSNLRIDGHL